MLEGGPELPAQISAPWTGHFKKELGKVRLHLPKYFNILKPKAVVSHSLLFQELQP